MKRTAADYLPERKTLESLKKASKTCRGCDLYKDATQTVFGEGLKTARLVFVGEQPGDKEDLSGEPFIGRAGELLDRALDEVGIDRRDLYVTNAVKHFKFIHRGKRRIHAKPTVREIEACEPWLTSEIEILKPLIIVCLGATAARAVFGKPMAIGKHRSKIQKSPYCENTLITSHPSSILRKRDSASRHQAYQELLDDLKQVKTLYEKII